MKATRWMKNVQNYFFLVSSIKENDESGEYYVGREKTITSSGPELCLTCTQGPHSLPSFSL